MKNKRGIFFSSDALIALTIILLVIIVLYPTITKKDISSSVQYDILSSFSTLKIGEVNNTFVKSLIEQGRISDLNKSVLEQIGDFYIEDTALASELAEEMLSTLDTRENIGIWYGEDLIFSINSTPYETAKNVETGRQMISGIKKGSPARGYVSKAWFKKIAKKTTTEIIRGDLMCGGWKTYAGSTEYCGTEKTNITYSFTIPENSTIINATWLAEPSWIGQQTELLINGIGVFNGNIQTYKKIDVTDKVLKGNNSAELRGSIGGDDGASHITIEYSTPDLQTFVFENKSYFNEVKTKSILYHEKSILIKNPISQMQLVLNVSSNTTLQIRKGAQTITVKTKSPLNNIITFSDNEIKTALSSNGISYSNLTGEYLFFIVKVGVNQTAQPAVLGKNSYIDIAYASQTEIPFGSVDITSEIPITNASNLVETTFYRDLIWKFNLPTNSIPVYADWQFSWIATGAGQQSEQEAKANKIMLYDSPPDPFISAFSRFGYTPSKANGVFIDGENNFSLHFGNTYSVSKEASYGSLTYFIKSYVNYGEAKPQAKGGITTLYFEDNSTAQIIIGDPSDSWDTSIDSIDDAVQRLFSQLDANNNGKIDIIITQDNIEVQSLDISNVPYFWSTEVQVRTWS